MKSFRILAVALSLLSLPTANVSAQVGIALTRGINRGSWDSDVHSFFKKDQRSITRSSTGLGFRCGEVSLSSSVAPTPRRARAWK